jgi:RND family efflux transporter MFP subunit
MKNFFDKIKTYAFMHKIISVIIIVVIIGIGFWGYKNATSPTSATRYVLSKVTKGTIISSVTDSGQVSAFNQITINPTVSGTLTEVRVKPGDQVTTGETLFAIDDTSAQQAVRNAKISLQNAELTLETTKAQSGNTDTNQQTTINNAYNSLLNSSFEAIPNNSGSASITTTNLPAPIITGNYTLKKEGVINIHFYTSSGGIGFEASGLTSGTSISSSSFASPIGNSGLFLTLPSNYSYITNTDWVINIPNTSASDYLSNYNAYQAALNAQNQTSSNSDLGQLNLQAEELAVTQAQNSLSDAELTLSDCYVTAPFNGIVASVPVIVGDSVSSGTTLGTIITTKDLATVTLSEVDVAKVILGDKATLTFNAIPNLTIAGQVVEIDPVGTVSSGVVNYNVQISFDATNNGGVKPGMSVNAAIITNVKQNVLMVPNGAIKTTGGVSYVQVFTTPLPAALPGVQGSTSTTPPKSQVVVTGVSNDTSTEIVSGLNEGDEVVTKTISSSTATTTAAPSILGGVGGGGRVGGGAVRIGG